MNNSIPQVTSIAAAAQSILEAHDTTVKVNVKAIVTFDDRVIDISAYIKDIEKTIADLNMIIKKTRSTYQRVENAHHNITNAVEAQRNVIEVELSKSELHEYVDDLNELVDVHVNSLNAAKGDLAKNINALIGGAEAATKMEKAILRVL